MRVVYVAGKFRGKNAWEVHQHVQEALKVGFEVAALGAMPFIPHANTFPFDGTLDDKFWLDGTLELLRRCDAVMTVDNWVTSAGAKAEVAEAGRIEIPVFHDLGSLTAWLVSESAVHLTTRESISPRASEPADVTPLHPMTREQACLKANEVFGRTYVVGSNAQYPDAPCYVGSKAAGEEWKYFGAGKTWEEAFKNVREVVRQRANKSFVFVGDDKEKKSP